jgi:23S rRNA (cytidine1920-2'-O)/16S rRNA (cytidine1409-2'-O)-methyltransferase
VTLVKPQFEADSPKAVGKGGLVKDADQREAALQRVCDWLAHCGWAVQARGESPIVGGDGNVEFLLWASRGGQ